MNLTSLLSAEKTLALMFLLVLFCMPGVTFAKNCESVIALSKLRNTVFSDKNEVEQHASNFCSEYKSSSGKSSSTNFGASYEFLSASFGSSNASVEAVASKYCSASDYGKVSQNAFKQYIESIAPGGFPAYEQCLRLSENDLNFNVNTASILPNQFTLTVTFVSRTAKNTANLKFSHSDDVTCKWEEPGNNLRTLTTGHSADAECKRDDSSKISYVTFLWEDGTEEPLTLQWKEYDATGKPVDSLIDLQNKVISVDAKLERLAISVDRIAQIGRLEIKRAPGSRTLDGISTCTVEDAGRADFGRPFSVAPTVTVGISSLNMQGGDANDSIRLAVRVTSVDANGFNYTLITGCRTKDYDATAEWLAIGR